MESDTVPTAPILCAGFIAALGLFVSLTTSAVAQIYASPQIAEECGRPTTNGEYDKAIECWQKYIAQNSRFTAAYVGMGLAYSKKGAYALAVASFSRAIQITPNHALALNLRGEASDKLGHREDAIADFKKALVINPNYVAARDNLQRLSGSPSAASPAPGATTAAKITQKPSFDCTRAKSAAARLICADDDLAQLDGQLGTAFQKKKEATPADQQTRFVADELSWIRERNKRCNLAGNDTAPLETLSPSKACMVSEIQDRIRFLSSDVVIRAAASPATRPDIASLRRGTYVVKETPCGQASNSVIMNFDGDKFFAGHGFCAAPVKGISGSGLIVKSCPAEKEGPETITPPEDSFTLVAPNEFIIKMPIGTSHYRYCEQAELPEGWRGMVAVVPADQTNPSPDRSIEPVTLDSPVPVVTFPPYVTEAVAPYLRKFYLESIVKTAAILNKAGVVSSSLGTPGKQCSFTTQAHQYANNGYTTLFVDFGMTCSNAAPLYYHFEFDIDLVQASRVKRGDEVACHLQCNQGECIRRGSFTQSLTYLDLFGQQALDVCSALDTMEATRQRLSRRMQEILDMRNKPATCGETSFTGLSNDDGKAVLYLLQNHPVRQAKGCITLVEATDKIKFTSFTLAKVNLHVRYPVGYLTDCFSEMPILGSNCNVPPGPAKPAQPGEERVFYDEVKF